MRKFGILLGLLMVGALGWRLGGLGYNLPVCANIDERTALSVLLRLSPQDPNPHFFNYPSLYFYTTWLLSRPFLALADPLLLGRIGNLLIGLALGPAAFFLAWQLYRSRLAGVVAAAATLASCTLTRNAGYLATDPLLTLLLLLAAGLLATLTHTSRRSPWLAAMLCLGLALGTKYTAFLMVAAYWLWELLPREASAPGNSVAAGGHERRFTRRLPALVLLLAGTLCAGLALAWPEQQLLVRMGTATKVDSALEAADLAWLSGLRAQTALLAAILVIASLAATRPFLAGRLARLRPHLAILLILAVFLVTTPFSLLSWREFLFDVGSELKANALRGEHRQWLAVLGWYGSGESLALVPAMLAGGIALRRSRAGRLVLLYLLLSYLAIGAARRGYPRYLTPILPFLFVLAGGGFAWARERFGPQRPRLAAGLLAGLLAVAAIESAAKLGAARKELQRPDEMWHTYQWMSARLPVPVLLAGYGPGVELAKAGWSVAPIPRQWLSDPEALERSGARAGDFLLMDGLARSAMHSTWQAHLQPMFSMDQGYGQYLYLLSPVVAAADSNRVQEGRTP